MAGTEVTKIAVVGFNRFGLGARPGDLAAVGLDIRGAILAEIMPHGALVTLGDEIVPSAEAYRRFRAEAEKIKMLQGEGQAKSAGTTGGSTKGAIVGDAASSNGTMPGEQRGAAEEKRFKREVAGEIFRAETAARLDAAKSARVGFAERLVHFWSNHFCVSVRKAGAVRILAGAYEREAIRPHVFGRFSSMLLAAERHPAMLVYLDNEQSVGPNSTGGQRRQKGLNENLAREIMELHTLGVDGGYTQEDVTSLARMLTGWRFARQENPLAGEGNFFFAANLHEPGDHKLMGVVYREAGESQGEHALAALAKHPATARHIAKKLATHFVSDSPSPALVGRLERTFLDTGGDLAAVSRALVESPEAWDEQASKIRLPYEFVAASVRATGLQMKPQQINGALAGLGQPLWNPPGPNGFSDLSGTWISPEGLKARLDFSARFADFVPGSASPSDVLEEVIGPIASDHTRVAVSRAESRSQGFALLLMSPEFQRR
jgi:uncharacterized protein (DUF1800 family)